MRSSEKFFNSLCAFLGQTIFTQVQIFDIFTVGGTSKEGLSRFIIDLVAFKVDILQIGFRLQNYVEKFLIDVDYLIKR